MTMPPQRVPATRSSPRSSGIEVALRPVPPAWHANFSLRRAHRRSRTPSSFAAELSSAEPELAAMRASRVWRYPGVSTSPLRRVIQSG